MTQFYMLDTNTVSYIVKGRSVAARKRLAELSSEDVACISIITEAELLYGVARSGVGEQRRKAVEWFIGRLKVLPWERETAGTYAQFRVRQEQNGHSLGPLDTLIAAHAIAVGAILVTNDQALLRLADLPGVENWATDL